MAYFAFAGWLVVVWGIEHCHRYGRFPKLASLIIFALPFNCALLGITWRVLDFLGLMD